MNSIVDLRSDTITRPSQGMRAAMAAAEVGDDVFGEDPTVNQLQERVASILGKEAALFTPTGVMANQLAIKVHTEPGNEIIVERHSHIFNYETAAPSLLSGVQMLPVEGKRGIISADQLEPVVRPQAYYMPRSSLICLENTHNKAGGTIYPLEEIKNIRRFADRLSIPLHLDGARLWNASVVTGIAPAEYARYFDSVSVCFSKGLGAPIGSMLSGTKAFIERARTFRKIFGGGMRQVGIMAAAALYALDHNIDRLKEDHEKARVFVAGISNVRGVEVDPSSVETNIVVFDVTKTGKTTSEVLSLLRSKGVLLTEAGYSSVRAVTHMDVSMEEVRHASSTIQSALP